MFAEVAVPVHVRQTFTYRLPGELALRAEPGCRVMVPFGKKFLTGFIVDLHETLQSEVDESDIKDIEELLDESPIITHEILELTRWVSDYYFAPWGECLRAALPAGAISISEQVLSLTDAGRVALVEGRLARSKLEALQALAGAEFVQSRSLERDLSLPQAGALIRQLTRDGLITASQRIGETRLKPRLQNAVRLTRGGLADNTQDSQSPGTNRRASKRDGQLNEK